MQSKFKIGDVITFGATYVYKVEIIDLENKRVHLKCLNGAFHNWHSLKSTNQVATKVTKLEKALI